MVLMVMVVAVVSVSELLMMSVMFDRLCPPIWLCMEAVVSCYRSAVWLHVGGVIGLVSGFLDCMLML